MKTSIVRRASTWAFWIFATLATLVFVLWIGSYFSGTRFYRSHWFETESESQESAHWLFSNGGALVIGRRSQSVIPKLDALPETQTELSAMTHGDRVALGDRSSNLAFWHWFRFSSETTPMGASSTTYSHVFIPWWSLFLPLLMIASAIHRSGPRVDSAPS